jgi:radical SAM superfamily enzyme YgiQ (UPF0313 family)
MKVIFSYPPLEGEGSPMLGQNRQFQWFHVPAYIYPLVPASAVTLLKEHEFEVRWNDCIVERWDYARWLAYVEAERPDLIAFETKTPVVRQFWRLLNDLKRRWPEMRTVIMGDHITALPEETMRECAVNYALTGGDFDFLLLGLAKHLRDGEPLPSGFWYRDETGRVRSTGAPLLNGNLNDLPWIDRDLTQADLYFEKWKRREPFFYTMVGRDCHWGRCTFCSWTTTFPKFRTRTPESLLDEIGFLIDHHGVREIFDDTGNLPCGGWLKRFCNGMIERGYNKKILFSCNMRYGLVNEEMARLMKRAGFRKFKMGLESANDETLERLDKGVSTKQILEESRWLSEVGIEVHLTIMVGYPWETRADAERTHQMAKTIMDNGWAEMLQSTVVMPYPGTPLYQQALDNDWFRFDPTDYDRFGMREPVFKTPDMTAEEVQEMSARIYKSFMTPRFIARHLLRPPSPEHVSYIYRGAKSVIGHMRDFTPRRSGAGLTGGK